MILKKNKIPYEIPKFLHGPKKNRAFGPLEAEKKNKNKQRTSGGKLH